MGVELLRGFRGWAGEAFEKQNFRFAMEFVKLNPL